VENKLSEYGWKGHEVVGSLGTSHFDYTHPDIEDVFIRLDPQTGIVGVWVLEDSSFYDDPDELDPDVFPYAEAPYGGGYEDMCPRAPDFLRNTGDQRQNLNDARILAEMFLKNNLDEAVSDALAWLGERQ